MSIPVLDYTNYQYTGQADSRAYNFPSGSSNTLLVVVVTGQGFASVPSIRGVTYNGVSMTQTGMGWPSNVCFTEMWYLVAPATGSNTLAINYSNGSNGNMNIAVYALSNVSQTLPVNELKISYTPTSFDFVTGQGVSTVTMSGTSIPSLLIDAFVAFVNTSSFFGSPDSGQTRNGNGSSYKYVTATSGTSTWNISAGSQQPGVSHQVIGITELKTISVTDTVGVGDSAEVSKGVLIKVVDGIVMSESFSWVKNIFITVSDTLSFKDRGWFGSVTLFSNMAKSVTDWLNQDKS